MKAYDKSFRKNKVLYPGLPFWPMRNKNKNEQNYDYINNRKPEV